MNCVPVRVFDFYFMKVFFFLSVLQCELSSDLQFHVWDDLCLDHVQNLQRYVLVLPSEHAGGVSHAVVMLTTLK